LLPSVKAASVWAAAVFAPIAAVNSAAETKRAVRDVVVRLMRFLR
jgi:hypothetical protein